MLLILRFLRNISIVNRAGFCLDNKVKGDMLMKKLLFFHITVMIIVMCSCSRQDRGRLVLIKGGTFKNTHSNFCGKNIVVSDFYIGKYEVTQREWVEIMGNNPSKFKGDDLPVEMVSWYDCIEYCNKRSIKEGFQPYYNIDKKKIDTSNKSDIDSVKWTVTINKGANGYRLPTEIEWEYAASGGQESENYKYSGSDNIDKVAWYWRNSGEQYISEGEWHRFIVKGNHCKTKQVGLKKPNELGLYDMSGNVREWCWDWYVDSSSNIISGYQRALRGGGWLGAEFACEISQRSGNSPNTKFDDQGFRVCRNK